MDGLIKDITQTFYRALRNPTTLALIAVTAIFIVTHGMELERGWAINKCANSTTVLCDLVKKEGAKLIGGATFLPALYDLPANIVTTTSLFTLASIAMLPPLKWPFYLIGAITLHMFFLAREPSTRLVIVLGAAFAWYLEIIAY